MNHHLNHYLIGVAALTLGGTGAVLGFHPKLTPVVQAAHIDRVNSRTWAPLTDDQKKQFAASVASLKGKPAVIICDDPECRDLAEDIDDSFLAAGLKSSINSFYPAAPGLLVGSSIPDDAAVVVDAATDVGLTAGLLREHVENLVISIGAKP